MLLYNYMFQHCLVQLNTVEGKENWWLTVSYMFGRGDNCSCHNWNAVAKMLRSIEMLSALPEACLKLVDNKLNDWVQEVVDISLPISRILIQVVALKQYCQHL